MSFPCCEKYSYLDTLKRIFAIILVGQGMGISPCGDASAQWKLFIWDLSSDNFLNTDIFQKTGSGRQQPTLLRGPCTAESMMPPHSASQASARSSLKQDYLAAEESHWDLDFIIRETRNVATMCSQQVKAGWSPAGWPNVVRVKTHTITQAQAVPPPTTSPTKTKKDMNQNSKSRFFSWIFQWILVQYLNNQHKTGPYRHFHSVASPV